MADADGRHTMAKIINFRRLERLEKQMDAMDAETPKLSASFFGDEFDAAGRRSASSLYICIADGVQLTDRFLGQRQVGRREVFAKMDQR
jgi:hypothetical protein